jgi:hypothetical protein
MPKISRQKSKASLKKSFDDSTTHQLSICTGYTSIDARFHRLFVKEHNRLMIWSPLCIN